MSRLPQRWRTQRNAIRNANCKTSWIIKILNAHCASGTFPVACLPECLRTPLRVVFLNTWCFDCISRQRDLCGVDVVSDSVYRVSLWRKRKRGKRTKWKRKIKFVTQTTVPRRSVVGRWTLYFRNPAVCFRVIFSHACLRTPLCVCLFVCVLYYAVLNGGLVLFSCGTSQRYNVCVCVCVCVCICMHACVHACCGVFCCYFEWDCPSLWFERKAYFPWCVDENQIPIQRKKERERKRKSPTFFPNVERFRFMVVVVIVGFFCLSLSPLSLWIFVSFSLYLSLSLCVCVCFVLLYIIIRKKHNTRIPPPFCVWIGKERFWQHRISG